MAEYRESAHAVSSARAGASARHGHEAGNGGYSHEPTYGPRRGLSNSERFPDQRLLGLGGPQNGVWRVPAGIGRRDDIVGERDVARAFAKRGPRGVVRCNSIVLTTRGDSAVRGSRRLLATAISASREAGVCPATSCPLARDPQTPRVRGPLITISLRSHPSVMTPTRRAACSSPAVTPTTGTSPTVSMAHTSPRSPPG